MNRQLWTILALLAALAPRASAQPLDSLIAISADIVEISGNYEKDLGFSWGTVAGGIVLQEKAIPTGGIFQIGDFARLTQLNTSLQLLETEGKAQQLSNPKVIVQAGNQAEIKVGGSFPIPVPNGNGTVTAQEQHWGVDLQVIMQVNPNKKDTLGGEVKLSVSNPDYTRPTSIAGASIPAMIERQMDTTVELKSGETLVLGGLKSSTKGVSKTKVPFLGDIPLLGLLFTHSSVTETQESLFLFVTVEIVK